MIIIDTAEEKHRKDLERLRSLRPMDDDFNCTDAADMHFKLLADRTRYLKENPKGVSEMCKVIEDMRREEREEGIREGIREGMRESMKTTALRMLADGTLALEKIAEYVGLPVEELKKLQAGEAL